MKIDTIDLRELAHAINSRADWHLAQWAQYMQGWTPAIGYPKRSALIATGGGAGDDAFDDLCDQADTYAARTCDSVIDSLRPDLAATINNVYLRSVFRTRGNPADLLPEALAEFWVRAQRWGLS